MQLPLICLDRVFHLGAMNIADFGRNVGRSSLEGNCLSVSLCPHAWQQIAKLGGHDLHDLSITKARFLDIYTVKADADLLATIVDWAVGEKLAKHQRLWRAWFFDPDIEEWRYFECDSEEDANDQVDQKEGRPDGGPVVEPVAAVVGSRALAKLTGMKARGPKDGDATEAVIMAWAMEHLPTFAAEPIHGVWWNETYDPDNLSAPRGGIFQSFIKRWATKAVNLDEIEDVEQALEADLVEVGAGPRP